MKCSSLLHNFSYKSVDLATRPFGKDPSSKLASPEYVLGRLDPMILSVPFGSYNPQAGIEARR